MQIDIISHRIDRSAALWTYIETRFTQAVLRFASQVDRMIIRLSDVNGSRGGVDKSCRVELFWSLGDPVIAEATDADPYVAVDLTASKLKRAVLRASRRRWEKPRKIHEIRPAII
ncbi:MAG: hypothetical protein KatS3mg104_1257 [Phycisphaerae bacterium]|jgi:ribosomal subunit interface protein|nr:MAG: hypothetical protein KatS3mg104_1257 [Phycisphaerae bacterium]